MVGFIYQVDSYRITWEDNLNEALSRSGWPVGVSGRNCLMLIGAGDPKVIEGGTLPGLGFGVCVREEIVS